MKTISAAPKVFVPIQPVPAGLTAAPTRPASYPLYRGADTTPVSLGTWHTVDYQGGKLSMSAFSYPTPPNEFGEGDLVVAGHDLGGAVAAAQAIAAKDGSAQAIFQTRHGAYLVSRAVNGYTDPSSMGIDGTEHAKDAFHFTKPDVVGIVGAKNMFLHEGLSLS